MKTIPSHSRWVTQVTLVAALASLILLPISALGQAKGAEHLMKLSRRAVPPPHRAEVPRAAPMSCPNCQDVTTRTPDSSAKGGASLLAGGRPSKSIVRHQCEGCLTTLTFAGRGKAKEQHVRHTCAFSGDDSQSCCATAGKVHPTER